MFYLLYNFQCRLHCLSFYVRIILWKREVQLQHKARKGFVDIVFLPLPYAVKPAIVVELIYDRTAHAAIQQIKERHYTQALEGYAGEILLVGINYDRDNVSKLHSCAIER